MRSCLAARVLFLYKTLDDQTHSERDKTMSRHRSFGKSTPRPKNEEPLTFDLEDEDFVCLTDIPGATLLDFVSEADSGNGARASQAVINFLTECIVDEDRERFAKLIRNPDKIIKLEKLAEICEWLVGEYSTARPTQASSPSARTPRRSGVGSTVQP